MNDWIQILTVSPSAERVETTSLVVAIVVLALLFVSFAALFYLYYRYFRKTIDYRLEDRYILKDMVQRSRSFFVKAGENYDSGSKEAPSYQDYLDAKAKRARLWKIIGNAVLVVFYLLIAALMIAAISIRAQGNSFKIGDKSYLVIKTGSMETVNPSNAYIEENHLDDQILTYSLIEIEEVTPEEMERYRIYAFLTDDGTLVVHRLIDMGSNGDGEMRYAFRGDANSTSASYEVSVPFERIVGVYTGWNNWGLGIFVNYAQSYIGIITLAFALILVGFYDILDAAIGKRIKAREDDLAIEIDADVKRRFATRAGFPYTLYLDRKMNPNDVIPPFLIQPQEPSQK